MSKMLNISSSPHIRDNSSTAEIMRDVALAMLPTAVYGVIQWGVHAGLVLVVTVIAAVLSEYLYEKFMKLPITVGDFSALVTGMILALNCPPNIPLWMPVIGAAFAIIVAKLLYGGLGCNFMNPALAARCFMVISFAGAMTSFTEPASDAVASATPLAIMKAGGETQELLTLFVGRIPGTIGEVSKITLLLGACYLIIRKVISPKIPLIYISTVAVFTIIFGGHGADLKYVLAELLSGGLIFGAFFMATDYVTSPITPLGQLIYAVCLGLLTGIFRIFGGSAEGVSYAIILTNILVPVLDKTTVPRAFGREGGKA